VVLLSVARIESGSLIYTHLECSETIALLLYLYFDASGGHL
jgi:hypothetical protein